MPGICTFSFNLMAVFQTILSYSYFIEMDPFFTASSVAEVAISDASSALRSLYLPVGCSWRWDMDGVFGGSNLQQQVFHFLCSDFGRVKLFAYGRTGDLHARHTEILIKCTRLWVSIKI